MPSKEKDEELQAMKGKVNEDLKKDFVYFCEERSERDGDHEGRGSSSRE